MKPQVQVKRKRSLLPVIISFCITITLLLPGIGLSAPAITGISTSSFNNGGNVTIMGSGFGSGGPNVVLFDDFEKGQTGQTIKTGAGSATYGVWSEIGNSPSTIYYTNSTAVSGQLAFQANMQSNWYSYIQTNLPAGTTNVFVSWWLYLPTNDNFPGYNDNRVNWKQMWIQGDSIGDDDLVVPTALGSSRNTLGSWLLNGNEQNPGYSRYLSINFSRGEWKRMWVWIKGGSNSNGQVQFYELTSSGVAQRINDNNINTLKSGGAFEKVRPNGYAASAPSCHPTFDDIYVASGVNARARVEIGNNQTYMSCTKLAILTPTTWSDDQVVATVRTGPFSSGESAYLFIFDTNGAVSTGKAITIGQSSSGSPPANPTGLEIVSQN